MDSIVVAATTPLPGSPSGPRRRATSNNTSNSRASNNTTVDDALVPTSQALVAHSHADPPDNGLPPNLPAPPASPTPDSNRILLDRLINVIHGLSAQVETLHAEVAALKVDARHQHDGGHTSPPSDAPCSRCRQKNGRSARAIQAENGGEDELARKLTLAAPPGPDAADEMGGGEPQYTKGHATQTKTAETTKTEGERHYTMNGNATQTTTAVTDESTTSDTTAETKKTDADDRAAAEAAEAAEAAHGRAKELRKARLQARVAAEANSFVPRPGCLFADELYQICYSSAPPPLARVRQLIANGINLRFQDYQGSCT